MPAHHGVGLSTFDITPRDSMHSNSFWNLLQYCSGTCLGVNKACDLASAFNLMEYSSPNDPNPVNTDGHFWISWVFWSITASVLAANLSAMIVGNPNKLVFNPWTTKMSCSHCFSPYLTFPIN